jgi:bifunctional UDP-N-acetylglucosamine pyrophosphorylase/glucosamine-1-phosphate N-acetyltransferase
MSINVVILAAGQGKRMHSARPKVLHRLAGTTLLEHVVTAARQLRPSRICIVYGHGGEQVPQAMQGDDLVFVRQKHQLGTGHAVKQALSSLDPRGDTLVLYGDVPLIGPHTLKALTAGRGERLRLLTANFENPYGYGRILRDARGAVTGIIEEKDATPAQRQIKEGSTGLILLPTPRMASWFSRLSNRNAQKEYYLTDVVGLALKDGVRIETAAPQALWEVLGVNSQRQLADLERIYQWEAACRQLDAGVNIADPRRFDLRGTLRCGADVRIDVNCVFEGNVHLGDGVEIGANCVIRNAKIGVRTRVAPFSVIDDARVGADCVVGPFARLRPSTELADSVHIGNFVEVKASRIGTASKANHLAYIGDTLVGRNVNVGAGTITCNYDGANKHQTIIEDDVFIGSDSQLVAPVTVRRGATIGAGSTITKDAPANQLTLSRAREITIADWRRPRKAKKGK